MEEKIKHSGFVTTRFEAVGEKELCQAVKAIFSSMFGEAVRGKEAVITIAVRNFFNVIETKKGTTQTSLKKIRDHIKKIEKLSLDLAKEIEWALDNPTVEEIALHLYPTDIERLFQDSIPYLDKIFYNASFMNRYLPEKGRFNKNPTPEGEFIYTLSIAYYEITGRDPNKEFTHKDDRESDSDIYYGEFYELITSVFNSDEFYKIYSSDVSGRTIQRHIAPLNYLRKPSV